MTLFVLGLDIINWLSETLKIVLTIFSVYLITLGYMNMDQCPACTFIPIFLIGNGFLIILINLINLENVLKFIKIIFIFWTSVGCFFVYKIYLPSYNSSDLNYCDNITYLNALYFCNIFIGFLIFIIIFFLTIQLFFNVIVKYFKKLFKYIFYSF